MKILIVEDQPDKLKHIYQCLGSAGATGDQLEDCRDTTEARRRLERRRYDLLIIDIVVPLRPDVDAAAEHGIDFLTDIFETDVFVVPDHIVGLTAFDDHLQQSAPVFGEHGLSIIVYERESEDWRRQLKAKAEHVLAAIRTRENAQSDYASDLAVVCALPDVELGAIRRLNWNWQPLRPAGDSAVYYRGTFRVRSVDRVVYAAASARMGMAAAAILTTRMIEKFRPRFLCIAGIAAGVRERINLGDILLAERSFDYGSGKYARVSGRSRFLVEPHHLQVEPSVRTQFRLLAEEYEWLARVKHEWPADPTETELRLRIGPLASGAGVLADNSLTSRILDQDRKLMGVDMEAYGVLAAVDEAADPRPVGFALKSICDFADEEKDDAHQRYAAYTSAMALQKFALTYL